MTVYEEIAREAKCLSLSRFLFEKGFGSDWVAEADYDWWRSAAATAGVNPPNPKNPGPTITRTIELLRERESGAFDAALDSTGPPEDGTAGPHPTPPPASAVPSEPSEAPGLLGPDVAAAPSGRQTGTDKLPASATASDDASHRPPTPSGPVVQASFDLDAARAERDKGMERVSERDPDWNLRALAAVRRVAEHKDRLIVDDVWRELDEPEPSNGRAMGPVMRKAAREGFITKTEEFKPSARVTAHSNPRRVWRSLLRQQVAS